MFLNFTIVGNGNSPVQELQNSVLGCLNEIICSLDKSMFHVAVNLLQCNIYVVAYENLDETLIATNT